MPASTAKDTAAQLVHTASQLRYSRNTAQPGLDLFGKGSARHRVHLSRAYLGHIHSLGQQLLPTASVSGFARYRADCLCQRERQCMARGPDERALALTSATGSWSPCSASVSAVSASSLVCFRAPAPHQSRACLGAALTRTAVPTHTSHKHAYTRRGRQAGAP